MSTIINHKDIVWSACAANHNNIVNGECGGNSYYKISEKFLGVPDTLYS